MGLRSHQGILPMWDCRQKACPKKELSYRQSHTWIERCIQEPKNLGEVYKGSFPPQIGGGRPRSRSRHPDSSIAFLMAEEKPRQPLAQSHTVSLGGKGGGDMEGGDKAKGPRSSGLCSYSSWGHSRSSLLRLPRRPVTEVSPRGGLNSRRDGFSGSEQPVPRTFPSPSPPLLWPLRRISHASARSNAPLPLCSSQCSQLRDCTQRSAG